MKGFDAEIHDRDIESCHRIDKSNKTIFCNCEISKRVLFNTKKLASINTSGVSLGNSTKLFIGENLTSYSNNCPLNVGNLKGLSSFIVLLQGMALFT